MRTRLLSIFCLLLAQIHLIAGEEEVGAAQSGRRPAGGRSSYPNIQPATKQPTPAAPQAPANPALPNNSGPSNSNPQGRSTPGTPNPSGRSSPSNQSGFVEEKKGQDPLAYHSEQQRPSPHCPCCHAHALAQSDSANGTLALENTTPAPPVNPPLRPVLEKGWNVWFRSDVLLWKGQEDNLVYCAKGESSPHLIRQLEQPEPRLEWGYRLDIGYNLPHDGWDLELQYTQIHNTGRGKTRNEGGDEVFGTLQPNEDFLLPEPLEKAHAKWRAKLNQLDFVLGREYAVSKFFTLRPNGGARSTWVYQTFNTSYRDESKDKQHIFQKCQFWGLGFVAGLDSDWKIGWGFSIYSDVAYSLLLGCFDVSQHGKTEGGEDWDFKKSFRSGKSIVDIDLGLKWGKLFAEGDWAMAFKIGYEYHIYFNQNQFQQSRGSTSLLLGTPAGGNLAYQGVTFSGQLDF
jgi:hypothetical protein